nr:hypothetical protein Iba_chr03fCG0220 [Ipomoea batatas]
MDSVGFRQGQWARSRLVSPHLYTDGRLRRIFLGAFWRDLGAKEGYVADYSNVPAEDTRNMPQGEEDTESEIEGITIEVKWLCKKVLSLCKHIDKLQAAVKTDFNSAQAEVDVLKVDISLLKSVVHNELSSPGLLLIPVHQRSKHLSLRPLAEPGMPGVGKLFVGHG